MGPDPKVQLSLNLLYLWAVKSHPSYLIWMLRPWTSRGLSGLRVVDCGVESWIQS